ncbi:sugar phosphate isomerase/epimerase family protein [Natronincola ferrireducens]|uniref:Sugar phosphate isomerase/epimerase n=1 Tax=Natronincola ferrireducens TaxID=393762 RepID=A0A1G9FZ95_9FIRM|nr:sugar phosphate isomerase/epimerase family protein [Natronincola ferrireducens]SDK93702.1 Sugar phosphate isomerase/epimerase [Natronincola ferrireducens]
MDYINILNRIGYAATLGEENILTALDFAKENGFPSVEINLNVPAFFPENYSREQRKAIRARVEKEKIALSFHAPEDIPLYHLHDGVRKEGLERLKECIDFGAEIGGQKITFHPGDSVCFTQTDKKIYLQEIYGGEFAKLLKESLIELRKHAMGKIMPCIENVGNFNGMIKKVLEELLPQGDLYLTWDIGHSYGKQGDIDFFMSNLKYVRNCHIHDHNGVQDHQVIGEGKINFQYYFNQLEDIDTSFILEVRPVEKALISRENLQRILQKF